MSDLPYEAEVMLLRWGESSTAGRTITLELPADGDVHPFRGMPVGKTHGTRLRIRFDVIRDDETIASEPPKEELISVERPREVTDKSAKAKATYAAKPEWQKALTRASLLCKDERFQAYVSGFASKELGRPIPSSEQLAINFIRTMCKVESRSAIGTDERAYKAFVALETEYRQSVGMTAEIRS